MKSSKLVLVCLLLVAVGLLASALTASAKPANPGFIVYTQPDGSKITVSMAGSDEWKKIGQTIDGYSLLPDDKGTFYYAVLDANGELVKSNVKAHDLGKRGAAEKAFVARLAKDLSNGKKVKGVVKPQTVLWNVRKFPPIGTFRALCILADFSDKVWSTPVATTVNAFNQVGYQSPVAGQTGSFRDFYLSQSGGLLDITVDVVGPYRARRTHDTYGADGGGWLDVKAPNLFLEMVNEADTEGVNFATYDNNNNGYCDPIMMICAGYDQTFSGVTTDFWAHMSGFNCGSPQLPDQIIDGKNVCRFIVWGELRTAGNAIWPVASATHEFGHCLGFQDTYNGAAVMGCYDQMATGSWAGGAGDNPSSLAGGHKELAGWATPTVLTSPATGVTIANRNDNPAAIDKINFGSGTYWYILENVKKVGWDAFVWNSGLLISTLWAPNPESPTPQMVAADNVAGCGSGEAGDVWPGSTNMTSFTDTTTPKNGSSKNLVNIAYTSYVSSFDLVDAPPPPTPVDYSCNSVVIDTGTLSSGDHTSTHVSDNVYLDVTALKSLNKFNAQETYTFDTGITGTLYSLTVTDEASLSANSFAQTISIYNPTTATWVSLGNNTLTTTDSTVVRNVTSPNSYKTAAGQIKVRAAVLNTGKTFIHKTDFLKISASVQ
jgi:M6 family metalloprotease-like protein